ncbi:glutathione S-transferase [Rhizobiales bacterium GAS191]|jgi:glutathione S-transferase|nr:glutathione S-transferase [Rhizobiales bacterium GAS188]SEE62975.1 glutathione S-transferase [Rhizobiales bacterium GAS191]
MKLYTFPASYSGRKVLAVVDHLALDVSIERLDGQAGDHRKPAYLALNPNGLAPTLVDGSFVLWESNAIMQYLADKAGSDALFPRDPRKRADIVRWQCWELAHFNKAFGAIAFETVAKPALGFGPTDEALVARAQRDLSRFAPVLESHLAARRHMVGEAVTIADYSVAALEGYRNAIAFDWSPFPNIGAYFNRMHERWPLPTQSAELRQDIKAA